MIEEITVSTLGQGLFEITDHVQRIVTSSAIAAGLCTLFIQHTSASLIVQENAYPPARRDLEHWLNPSIQTS